MMRHALYLVGFLLLPSAESANANDLTINFTNQASDAINGITAIPMEPPAPPPQETTESLETPDESNLELSEPPNDGILELSFPPDQNILVAPIAAGDAGIATIDAADGVCVFKLTFTFASGRILERADTDVCRADGIIVE